MLAPSPQPSDEVKDSAGLILLMKTHLSSKMIDSVSMRYQTARQFTQPINVLLKTGRGIHQISFSANGIDCLLHISSEFAVQ